MFTVVFFITVIVNNIIAPVLHTCGEIVKVSDVRCVGQHVIPGDALDGLVWYFLCVLQSFDYRRIGKSELIVLFKVVTLLEEPF